MTVNPGAGATDGPTELTVAPATLDKLARAYIATYHGPHGDAPTVDTVTGPVDMSAPGKLMSAPLLAAHYKLGRHRKVGETLVEYYPSDDPGGTAMTVVRLGAGGVATGATPAGILIVGMPMIVAERGG